MIKHKFNAIPSISNGIKFASKKEMNRYEELKLFQKSGIVVFFTRQQPFHLLGGVKYVCDFTVYWADGSVTFEDVKGLKTPTYIMKKKMVEELYPIKIVEI